MSLYTNLSQFKGVADEDELQKIFKNLASSFLYGGYINVRDEYKIYIRTVEFYFHSENLDGIHDPIVYHRNGKGLNKVAYFPLMTLHAHDSGFDITFESEVGQYRASALIRAYEVINKEGKYLKWVVNKTDSKKSKFKIFDDYQYNTQSTYLYILLNGFTLGNTNSIEWIDLQRIQELGISAKARQGVYKSADEYEYKPIIPKVKCDRKWSFTREDKV
ncbi:MAG: hypothetical protein E7142_02090 [Rikenellaceae bacterium]|jgi:hypothetical protein|nr:hypothetical protein [Rikenellaceae bacterium]